MYLSCMCLHPSSHTSVHSFIHTYTPTLGTYIDMPEIYRMKPEERQKELERMSDRQNELDREVEEKRAKLKADRAKRKGTLTL